MDEMNWKCGKCGAKLQLKRTIFHYMGRDFGHEVPTCPECGKVFISAELAGGRMAEVEQLMEDK